MKLDNGNWRAVENLKAGDRVVTSNGDIKTIYSGEEKHYNEARRIYNLNVDEFHTYFVGSDELLVHNNRTEVITKSIETINNNLIESRIVLVKDSTQELGFKILTSFHIF